VYLANVAKFVWKHPANQGAQVRAVARVMRFQTRGRLLRRRTLAQLGAQSKVWADVNRHAALKVVCANPPDHPEMLVWSRNLQPGDLFVDVGANIGTYTIWAGELGAEIIALEPARDTFALLVENVALNGYSVRTVQAAIGAACGTARFTDGRDDRNCLDPEGTVEIPIMTIDSIVEDRVVAGIKIDVEGFEIEVIRGCERALSEHRLKLIQLEWNSTSQIGTGADRRPVADLLAKHGYRLYRPDDSGGLAPLTDLSFGPDVFARPDGIAT
jgi:FkbM family methyltransferase